LFDFYNSCAVADRSLYWKLLPFIGHKMLDKIYLVDGDQYQQDFKSKQTVFGWFKDLKSWFIDDTVIDDEIGDFYTALYDLIRQKSKKIPYQLILLLLYKLPTVCKCCSINTGFTRNL